MKKIAKWSYSIIVFLFLYAPIAVLIIFSFNSNKSRGKWGGFTLDWYRSLFQNDYILSALKNTVIIAIVSAVVATILGTFAAVGINMLNKRLKRMLMSVTNLPVLNPDIVTGVSLLLLFMFLGIKLGYPSLLLAHITFNTPYVILSVMPKLQALNKHSYEAALDLGCKPLEAFFKVILPEIMPGVITGFILAITLSIDDFVISFFTTGNGVDTLSIAIYSMARHGIKPEINALSSIMFVVVLSLLIVVNIRSSKESNQGYGSNKRI